CYLFLDKASQHYKSHRVRQYLEKNNDNLIPVWLPTASPEFMVLEESWNISKKDLPVLTYYHSFRNFRKKISGYFRKSLRAGIFSSLVLIYSYTLFLATFPFLLAALLLHVLFPVQ
ncbi:MAG: transposase, partial [Nitrososphaeraceae archaeon]|nr:transposase [Nitrososphaeraceae archaeon]